MKKSKKPTPSDLQAADNIEDLKEKMLDMQMGCKYSSYQGELSVAP